MENFSIYKYMKLGIVHFKAFPLIANGRRAPMWSRRTGRSWKINLWTAIRSGVDEGRQR